MEISTNDQLIFWVLELNRLSFFFFIFFFVFFPYVKETCCTAIRNREIHREEMEKKGRRFPWQFRSFRLMPYMCVWNVKHDIYP